MINDILEYLNKKLYFPVSLFNNHQSDLSGVLSIVSGKVEDIRFCDVTISEVYNLQIIIKNSNCENTDEMLNLLKAMGIVNDDGNGALQVLLCNDSAHLNIIKSSISYSIDRANSDDNCYLFGNIIFTVIDANNIKSC